MSQRIEHRDNMNWFLKYQPNWLLNIMIVIVAILFIPALLFCEGTIQMLAVEVWDTWRTKFVWKDSKIRRAT